jgi:hypothetical protein
MALKERETKMTYAIDTADRRRRRALRAATPFAALLVAALLVWQGSNAAFSAQTYNTGDAWATGSLALTNNGGAGSTYSGTTSALFGESNLKPGDSGAKCITVQSTGSLPGNLRLYRGAITGTNSAALAAELQITVDVQAVSSSTNVVANCTGYSGGTGGALFSNTLSNMPATYAAASGTAVAGGTQRYVYRIGWTLPSSAGNSVQSSNAVADLTWEIN